MQLSLGRTLMALGAALAVTACGNDDGGNGPGPNPQPGAATISGAITANRTLSRDTTYTLSGYVKVQNGVTLTIQPGTRIVGDTTVPGSSLWILRGARLVAEGTATQPIVFTSARSAGNRAPGDWGGIILIGNARINRTATSVLTEGGAAGQAENYAGGTNDADNSGSLRYVRIEFAGFDISSGAGQELNGLSMYAVGSGTRVEYVEVLAGLDDSFEWWGGTVDGRYLISAESGDDHFDWTEGYRGRNQFLIAYQSTRLAPRAGAGTLSSDPRAFEADGCDPNPTTAPDCAYVGGATTPTGMNTPFSNPVMANFTVIGPGSSVSGFPTDGNGIVLRRGTGGRLDRGIVANWPGLGLDGRDAWTDSLRARDSLSITNVVLGGNLGGDYNAVGASGRFFQATRFAAANHRTGATVAQLFTTAPAANNFGDWRPQGAAAAIGTAVTSTRLTAQVTGYPYSGGWQTTSYVGAVDPSVAPTAQWYAGWTSYFTN